MIPNFILPKVTFVQLQNNQLTGSIPNFNNCPKLENVHLNSNQLSGSFPNLNCPQLFELNCSMNQLTGSIASLNQCPLLTVLDCSKNQLSGSLPDLMDHPYTLNFSSNRFTGSLPNWKLDRISTFNVSNNLLSGCIPLDYRFLCSSAINVDMSNNPNLSNQNFATFCSNNIGACAAQAVAGKNAAQNADNQEVSDLKIFPNPAKQAAFIDLKDFANQKVELSISDIVGKVIRTQTIEKASVTPHLLPIATLGAGTYFVTVQMVEKQPITSKLQLF